MNLAALLKLLHILSAFWFVSGLVGRALAFRQASQSVHIQLAYMLLIPLYLVPRRRQRARVAEAALAQGQVTPELTAALNDQGVIRYRMLELVVAGIVTLLMVTKPF